MAHAKRLGLPLVDLTWTAADPALAAGMVPITQAALDMARKGLISLNEAYRVRAD